jgi:hypothetical protein
MGDDAMEALLDDIKKSRSVNISTEQAQNFFSLIKDVSSGFITPDIAKAFASNILKIDEQMTNPIFDQLQIKLNQIEPIPEKTLELPNAADSVD